MRDLASFLQPKDDLHLHMCTLYIDGLRNRLATHLSSQNRTRTVQEGAAGAQVQPTDERMRLAGAQKADLNSAPKVRAG
jgi:hypothetical protein